ncbi:hypothetical protein H702_09135 [Streptococcus equinus JB1]|uniref:Uncharacterized protein n=1 Tax=Streptococcus equinus JB1 TaxID=1294274 RepID=A0A091BS08_STREI|nr:hypothetical protein [Streptococcus equinus]KFN86537.1 hypothetical protein H702_09135 [Streptococcus equinus JB1]SFL20328.1 hypothetical protein SAMN02910290_00857 [Streptococcus equinus JB1]
MNIFDVIAILLSLTAIAINVRIMRGIKKQNKPVEIKFNDHKDN